MLRFITICVLNEKKWIRLYANFLHILQAKLGQEDLLKMVRWFGRHCPPDTGFEIQTLEVWGRARYISVTEAPHNSKLCLKSVVMYFLFNAGRELREQLPSVRATLIWREKKYRYCFAAVTRDEYFDDIL